MAALYKHSLLVGVIVEVRNRRHLGKYNIGTCKYTNENEILHVPVPVKPTCLIACARVNFFYSNSKYLALQISINPNIVQEGNGDGKINCYHK